MSNLFQEMMPDNVPEFLLSSGLSFACLFIYSNLKEEVNELKEFNRDSLKLMKEQEENFIQRVKAINDEHEKYCEQNTISNEAKEYLRSL
jgi:hypothetical protein